MKTLPEIKERLRVISDEMEDRGEPIPEDKLDALEKESSELLKKKAALIAANEKRAALIKSLEEGREPGVTVVRSFPSPGKPDEERTAGDDDKYASVEYRRAFMNHVMRGSKIPAEYRADALTKTTDVGAMIPTTTLNKIIEKLESVGMILPLVTRTAYKGGLSIPTSTAKPVASWVSEGAGSDKQKKTTGSISFKYHKLRCAVAVSLEVDTMALSAFEASMTNGVVNAMIKALEQAIISGEGENNGKPKGILAETPVAGQKIGSLAPSYVDLISAEAALPVEYENGAVWCMTKKTFMQYYGLTDETGQPIGRVNYGIAGKPERSLLGRSVVVCNYLPSFTAEMATGTVFAFLFNFSDYVLNTNYAMGIKRYEDNETDDQVTKAIMLADGKAVDVNSLVTISKSE